MNNSMNDFSSASTASSQTRRLLILVTVLIALICICALLAALAYRFAGDNRLETVRRQIDFLSRPDPSPTPSSSPTLTSSPSPLPSPTAIASPTATLPPTTTPSPTVIPSPTFPPTFTPQPTFTPAPTRPAALSSLPASPTPAQSFANGSLEQDDFGTIANWLQTDLELFRWYLIQASPNNRWVERVNLTQEGRGYGLRSIDRQSCTTFCNTAAVQIVPAQEHMIYTLSVDTKKELVSANGTIYLDFLDANRFTIEANALQGGGEQWQSQTLTAAAPPGTAYLRIVLYSDNEALGVIYWDKVELKAEQAPNVEG